jgi:hypothetical protein
MSTGVTIFERRAHYRLILTVLTLIWDRSMSFFYANVYRAFSRRLKSLRSVMKIFAARIGPTVWDEDGPTRRKASEGEKKERQDVPPMLKRSKVDMTACSAAWCM